MKSEWRVSRNPILDDDGNWKSMYQVYRIRDANKTDHSGNREVFDTYISKELAEMKAYELNAKENRR